MLPVTFLPCPADNGAGNKNRKRLPAEKASDINSMNLSSCQVAQGLVGGCSLRRRNLSRKFVRTLAVKQYLRRLGRISSGVHGRRAVSSVRDKASDKDKERVLKNQISYGRR